MMKRPNVNTLRRREQAPLRDAPSSAARLRFDVSRTARRGIALIDVIIGALMLGAGLAVIISLNARSIAAQGDGERRMTAAWLADELLTMVLVEGPDQYSLLYDMDGWFYAPFEDYFYAIEITDRGPGIAYDVVARVGWELGRGTQEIVIAAAIAARRGDPEQPRAPKDRIDRETRHYERLFGEAQDPTAQVPRVPANAPSDQNAPRGGGGGRGGSGGR